MAIALALCACVSRPVESPHSPPEFALPNAPDAAFAQTESAIRDESGADASGFMLLDRTQDGLKWRLLLIDSARHSIDAQYYLWYGDAAGDLLIKHLLDAADRGVRVRLLVDDLTTMLAEGTRVKVRDEGAALVDSHPNIEIRVFNPWTRRSLMGRAGEAVLHPKRLNRRMHNKLIVADNDAVILGGRNIGNDYMGLNEEFNFHDLDVLGIGPIAREASAAFDDYWNSELVMPISALKAVPSESDGPALRAALTRRLESMKSLQNFPVAPQPWTSERSALLGQLHVGTGRVYSDIPKPGGVQHQMVDVVRALALSATEEMLLVNAYIIPSERTIDLLKTLRDRQVRVRILTNSLASHDVPAVNSHYKKWRKPLLNSGAKLFEIRHDAAIQSQVSDTPPTRAEFMGLHSKAMVVDRQHVFIGSMNFDPRSVEINSEMGAIIDSPGLGEALAQTIERDMLPANSWQVSLGSDGQLRWSDDREVVTRQPARSGWQRVQDVIFMLFPKSLY
jgi:putative cardiolipin synthase